MQINTSTPIYAVFGDPIAHSLSPLMHNSAFSAVEYNGVYLAFRVESAEIIVSSMKNLGLKGASITIPHKITVMDHLDHIDPMAEKIGAVNTIVNKDGVLTGYNTDGSGAVKALREKTKIEKKNIAIIGAGGAARAIGFETVSRRGRVTIFNRSATRGEKLALEIGADFYPLSDFSKKSHEILINTTPIGMAPNTEKMPINKNDLVKDMVVMDAVYNPLKTTLLQTAEVAGCTVISGVYMFIYQGVTQFELWTGKSAPVQVMSDVVIGALTK